MDSPRVIVAVVQDGWNNDHRTQTRHKGSHLRAHTLGPGGNGSFKGLLLSQAPGTEAMMVEVKGDGHACTPTLVNPSVQPHHGVNHNITTCGPQGPKDNHGRCHGGGALHALPSIVQILSAVTACAFTGLQRLGWRCKRRKALTHMDVELCNLSMQSDF